MKHGWLVPAVGVLFFAGCAGHEQAAVKAAPPAPPVAAFSAPIAPSLGAAASLGDLVAPLSSPALEPLACPIYAGADRPDLDADGLSCLAQWMRETQDYLAKGGAPTKYTDPDAFERNRGYARELQARLGKFVAQARYDGGDTVTAKPAGPLPVVPPSGAAAALSPQLQRMANALEPLNCLLYGPEGRPDEDAKGLKCLVFTLRQTQYYVAQDGKPTQYLNPTTFETDRANAALRLARLDKFFGSVRYGAAASPAKPAPPPAPDAHAASAQAYLEGVIEYQKGDYARARKAWDRALTLDPSSDDTKAALSRLDRLEKGN